ncbi:fumarate reductase subunit FrdD [Blastococcus deserti]|uniref:Fumarate reductase subunit FrdD n=1 Tax=Blastococcus deserti TaxID=2259033 RepID=A0ABW4X7N4_9ACTN
MTRRRIEPLVWLMFSAGGVLAAVLLPSLVLLFGLGLPLGWLDPPDHQHLLAFLGHPVTFVVLLGAFVLMLVHSAHRFRYTLYDGLQIKMKRTVAVLTYGAAIVVSVAALAALWVTAQAP